MPNSAADDMKQFGRLTGEQVVFAVSTSESLAPMLAQSLPALLRSEIAKRVEEDAGSITWAWVYDLPYFVALACSIYVLGLIDELKEAVATENPTAAAIELVRVQLQIADVHVPEGITLDALRIELLVAWHFNDEAIRNYSVSINELVQKARAGNDQPLFDAASIDPTVAGCDVFLRRLGRAKVLGRGGFLKKYRAALKGPHVRRRTYRRLRWTDYLLRDIGASSTATSEEIFDLVAMTLKQYPTNGKDPVKGLQSRRDAWKKEATS